MTVKKNMIINTNRDFEYNISIIVPIYNAETTIQETLRSLLNQTLQNIEIICIDDGSSDSTPALLSFFQSKHPDRIKYLSIPNQGVYEARSRGIKMAQGKYIGFCDSDDIVESSMYEILFNKAEETTADLTVCAYWRQDNNNVLSIEMQHSKLSWCSVDNSSGWLVSINTAVWNKLIRSDIAKNHLKLQNPPKITEDALFLFSLYPYINRIAFVSNPQYHYLINNSTAMKSLTKKDAVCIIDSWRELRLTLKQDNPAYIPIIDLAAFIHLALSLPLIMVKSHSTELKAYLSDIRKIMETDFSTLKHCKFLRLPYVIKYRSWMVLPFFASILYRLHLLAPVLKIYAFLTSILGRDLKW